MVRRRYDQRTKLRAVALADVSTVAAAAVQLGIPESNVRDWVKHPRYAELRAKTREDLAEEFRVLAHAAVALLVHRIESGDIDSRDLIPAMGVATEKSLLLTGSATSRSETRDITGSISDADLLGAVREAVALTSGGGTPPPTEDAPEG